LICDNCLWALDTNTDPVRKDPHTSHHSVLTSNSEFVVPQMYDGRITALRSVNATYGVINEVYPVNGCTNSGAASAQLATAFAGLSNVNK
jgi:hypothetical protein